MKIIKDNKYIIIGIAVIIGITLFYMYSPVDIIYGEDTAARDTIQALRDRVHQREEDFRLSLETERQSLRDSANLEVVRRQINANYYKSLYERSQTQNIDSVTARTHEFWTNFEIPEYK